MKRLRALDKALYLLFAAVLTLEGIAANIGFSYSSDGFVADNDLYKSIRIFLILITVAGIAGIIVPRLRRWVFSAIDRMDAKKAWAAGAMFGG